jgi:hypothetical protein
MRATDSDFSPQGGDPMKKLFLYLLLLFALFAYAVYKSGTIEKVEYRKISDVPGVPDRSSVEYQFHWDRLSYYIKSFLPR